MLTYEAHIIVLPRYEGTTILHHSVLRTRLGFPLLLATSLEPEKDQRYELWYVTYLGLETMLRTYVRT